MSQLPDTGVTAGADGVPSPDAAMSRFERQTTRYGSITMLISMLLSLVGPLYLVFFGGLEITWNMVWVGFLAVAATFGIFWVIEPLTYYPILGQPAMYQTFMIGNISNKLLPAVIVAQSSIDARPGSRRGDIAAVMAIAGAATVHLTSLLIFVGFLGTWLVSLIPQHITDLTRVYILPAILGAVLVQSIASMKQPRATVLALAGAVLIQFAVLPFLPQVATFATGLSVLLAVLLTWFTRKRTQPDAPVTTVSPPDRNGASE